MVTVAGTGMINPVGVGVAATLAAVRAGINLYSASSLERSSGEPYKMGTVPNECLPELTSDLNQSLARNTLYRRLLQLAKTALSQAGESAGVEEIIPLYLAVPEQRCGRPFPALEPILKDLSKEVDFPIDLISSKVFPFGRAGGVTALKEALDLLNKTSLESIIVGGVDSYLDFMLLNALDREQRILSDEYLGGFAPGEGAAFLVLKKTDRASVVLSQPGTAEEPGHMYSEEICLGDGLSTAVGDAVANLEQPVN